MSRRSVPLLASLVALVALVALAACGSPEGAASAEDSRAAAESALAQSTADLDATGLDAGEAAGGWASCQSLPLPAVEYRLRVVLSGDDAPSDPGAAVDQAVDALGEEGWEVVADEDSPEAEGAEEPFANLRRDDLTASLRPGEPPATLVLAVAGRCVEVSEDEYADFEFGSAPTDPG